MKRVSSATCSDPRVFDMLSPCFDSWASSSHLRFVPSIQPSGRRGKASRMETKAVCPETRVKLLFRRERMKDDLKADGSLGSWWPNWRGHVELPPRRCLTSCRSELHALISAHPCPCSFFRFPGLTCPNLATARAPQDEHLGLAAPGSGPLLPISIFGVISLGQRMASD